MKYGAFHNRKFNEMGISLLLSVLGKNPVSRRARTLQETLRNMREVLELMLDVKDPQLEVRLRHDAVEVFV